MHPLGIGNRMDFTFVVISYNQQDWILEALESIRYQVEKYAGTRSVQLIIGDDGSKDDTQNRIKIWTSTYESLFEKIDLVLHEENIGTCKNVASAYRKILGNHIVSIAGDDMLSNCDIFAQVEKCGDNEIVADPPVFFDANGVVKTESAYYSNMTLALKPAKKLKKVSKYGCPFVNGAYLGKAFYTNENILLFSEEFNLLDDQARFMKLFEEFPVWKYRVSYEPILLYRRSDMQITKSQGKTFEKILDDKKKLCKHALKTTINPLLRISIRMSYYCMRYPALNKKLFYVFNPEAIDNKLFCIMNKPTIKDLSCKIIEYAEKNEIDRYIEEIINRKKIFEEKYLCTI